MNETTQISGYTLARPKWTTKELPARLANKPARIRSGCDVSNVQEDVLDIGLRGL
jgi:hypothetical protein